MIMVMKVRAIYNLYKHNRITKEQVYSHVPKLISAEEYEEIVGEKYKKK